MEDEQQEGDRGPKAASVASAVVAPPLSLVRRRLRPGQVCLVGVILYSSSCPAGARVRGPPTQHTLRDFPVVFSADVL